MKYRENKDFSKKNKQNYVDGVENLIKQREKEAESVRKDYIKDIFNNPEKYRQDLKEMLGWPLCKNEYDEIFKISEKKLSDEDDYSVFRMEFEILNGLVLSGLLFKIKSDDSKPLVIVQHGGEGTPELISGIYGSTANYNDMLKRVRKHGIHVFAPQLLLWSNEYEVGYERSAIDARLKRVGSSISAVEIYAVTKIMDYFENQEYVKNFGMVGLSYGGFYTQYIAAIDTRIKSAISCSFFNTRDIYRRSDWTWYNSAEKFDDAEIACLVYPRKLYLQMGTNDNIFNVKYSIEAFKKLKSLCENVGNEWVEFVAFDGAHEFDKNDLIIEKFIADIL